MILLLVFQAPSLGPDIFVEILFDFPYYLGTQNYIKEIIFFGTDKLKYNFWYPKGMNLLSQKHSEYKGKQYKKFWIIIPNRLIEKLGWKEELQAIQV